MTDMLWGIGNKNVMNLSQWYIYLYLHTDINVTYIIDFMLDIWFCWS